MDVLDLHTRPEALYSLATVALHADDQAHPAELRVLDEILTQVQPIASLSEQRAQTLREAVEASTTPSVELAEACCDALSPEDAGQAFGLTLDIVLADRDVDEAERVVLDTVRSNLALRDATENRLVDLLETKHSAPLADLDLPELDDVETMDVSPPEALLAFPVAAMDAAQGQGPLVLPPVRDLVDLPASELAEILHRLTKGLELFGREEFLTGCAAVLEEEEREQAFILVAQTVYMDEEITARESAFLEEARKLLDLSQPLADQVVESVQDMHRQ